MQQQAQKRVWSHFGSGFQGRRSHSLTALMLISCAKSTGHVKENEQKPKLNSNPTRTERTGLIHRIARETPTLNLFPSETLDPRP